MDERDLIPGSSPIAREDLLVLEKELRAAVRDETLRFRWNPESYVTSPGCYDVYGLPVQPKYDGRFEVVKFERGEVVGVIYQVRWEGEPGEPYRAPGPWLIEQFRVWDRQNVHWMEEMRRRNEGFDLKQRGEATDAEALLRENLDRKAFDLSSDHWNVRKRFGTSRTEELVS